MVWSNNRIGRLPDGEHLGKASADVLDDIAKRGVIRIGTAAIAACTRSKKGRPDQTPAACTVVLKVTKQRGGCVEGDVIIGAR